MMLRHRLPIHCFHISTRKQAYDGHMRVMANNITEMHLKATDRFVILLRFYHIYLYMQNAILI